MQGVGVNPSIHYMSPGYHAIGTDHACAPGVAIGQEEIALACGQINNWPAAAHHSQSRYQVSPFPMKYHHDS